MTKSVIGFILSLYVLFPGVFAHNYSPEKILKGPVQAHFSTGQTDEAQIGRIDLPGGSAAHDKTKAIEVQEDEAPGSSKKYTESRNPFITLYSPRANSDISCYFKSRLPFCEHFSYSASHKFIIHRVIRI